MPKSGPADWGSNVDTSGGRLRALVEHGSGVAALLGRDGTVEYVSPAVGRALGYASEALVGTDAFGPVHPDDVASARGRFAELVARPGASAVATFRLRHQDGSWRWVENRLTNLLEEPSVRAVVSGWHDVTDRKHAEDELVRQREYWRVALTSIGDATLLTDADGRVTFMNPVAEALCGWAAAEAAGKALGEVFRIIHETTRRPVECPVQRVLRERRAVGLANHTVLVARNGTSTPIDDSAAPIVDPDGNITGVVLVFRDVRDRKEAEELRDRLAAIVESSDDVIVSKDLNGVITSWNKGAERVLGYKAEEVVGKHVSMLMPPGYVEDFEKILGCVRRGERVDHYETKRRRKDGTVIDVSLTVSPIRNGDGEIIGASKVGRDITAQKIAEAERNEADRRKDEFLAMLAHELRNPLASINSAVQLFGKLEAENELEWAKEVVQRQVRHLSRLIDDLLDVSRITRGKILLRKEPVSLGPIINSAVEVVRPLVEERKQEMSVSLAATLRLEADPVRLEQVVVNLLTNAAKYTEAGGRVALSAHRDGSDVVIAVRDSGVGISPELLPRVFDLFVQGDRTMARSEGGLGIGLTLVKSLVEMHGGTVTAASDGPGRGSEFTVRLPALQAATRDASPARPAAPAACRSVRVLVVDDNEDTARSVSKLIRLLGHDVRTAFDGPGAIDTARAYSPEVVFLDIGLPGMDGYEIVKELRKDDCCKHAFIVAVSGYGQEEDRRRSRAAGFDRHLVKPVEYEALIAALAESDGKPAPR
jgi:PAS domain S-box-containing protein